MSDDKSAVPLKEVQVGTVDCGGLTAAHWASGPPDDEPRPPALAEVDLQRRQLRDLLLPAGTAATSDGDDIASLRSVTVEADELDRIACTVAALEPFERWAKEEATQYETSSSVLAQVGAPAVVVACLLTRRARIVSVALHTLTQLLAHPQSCSETLKAVAVLAPTAADAETHPLPVLLADIIERAPGVQELCAAATEAAAALANAAARFTFCAAVVTADDFMEGTLVARVLGAAHAHPDHVELASATAHFFASVAALPRRGEGGDVAAAATAAAALPTPAPILFTYVGTVLETVVLALRMHGGNTTIRRGALAFLRACAAYRQNLPRLLEVGAYALVMRALRGRPGAVLGGDSDIVLSAAATASAFPPILDGFQRRGYVLAVHRVLVSSGDAREVRAGLVMLHALLRVVLAECATAAPSGLTSSPATAFGVYALYRLPVEAMPAEQLPRQPIDGDTDAHGEGRRTLHESAALSLLAGPRETVTFLHVCCIPQLVGNAHDYYRRELVRAGLEAASSSDPDDELDDTYDEEERKEREVMRGIVALAERCLATLMKAPTMYT